MKYYSLLTLALFAMAANNAQSAIIVAVGNSSFETVGTKTGSWYALPGSGDWAEGTSNPFQILDISLDVADPPHFSSNAGFGDRVLNLSTASPMTQDLSYAINTGDQISLSFYIGNSARVASQSNITATIMLDGSDASPGLVATNTAAEGGWAFKTLTWTADAGGNLGLKFASGAGGWMDAVSVEVTPVPEPSAALLAGLGALLLLRRRRHS